MSLSLMIDDVVRSGDTFYCKSPAAFDEAKATLEKIGYGDSPYESQRSAYGLTPEQTKMSDARQWTGQLQTAYVGKCGSCKRYIKNGGIQTHGHRCELCGAVTYLEFVKGSTIRFEFRESEPQGLFPPELRMTVRKWDTEEGYLYFDYEFLGHGLSVKTGDEALALLDRYADRWELVEKKGRKLLKIRYELRVPHKNLDTDAISITDSFGSYRNFTTRTLWDLHEYASRSDRDIPLPSFVYLNAAWQWAPLTASPTLYKSVLGAADVGDNVDHYSQWPEIVWMAGTYRKMASFVREFTTMDADEWDRQATSLPEDPIVGIEAVRALCWPGYTPRDIAPRRGLGRTLLPWGRR